MGSIPVGTTKIKIILINLDYRGFWYFDENQMILESLGWEDGKGDSVGRNAFAYISWPNESWLKDTIMQCVKMGDDGFVQFYRYPGKGGDTMSRDHVGAILLALYINRDEDELNWILNNLPWAISRKYNQTVDFWIWTKCLKRSIWKYPLSQVFYVLVILQFLIILPWNNFIRIILGVKKYSNENLPKYEPIFGWKKKLSKSIYPQFALFLLSWQIRVCSNCWLKVLCQWFVRQESGNIVIDAILGKRILDIEWIRYKPCTSFIWSRRLDSLDDVWIERLEKLEYNDLNKGMLDYLYFGIDNLMLEYNDLIVQAIKDKQQIIRY